MSTVQQLLAQAMATYGERNATYADNYKRYGEMIVALFGGRLPRLQTPADWNRMGVYMQCVAKLSRYAAQWEAGGHKDSAHDLIVYAAMLEELS